MLQTFMSCYYQMGNDWYVIEIYALSIQWTSVNLCGESQRIILSPFDSRVDLYTKGYYNLPNYVNYSA